MKQSVKMKVVRMVVVFLIIITGVAAFFLIQYKRFPTENKNREQILALNEIEKLTEINGISPAKRQIEALQTSLLNNNSKVALKPWMNRIMLYYFGCVLFVIILFLYLYIVILRPFEKLEQYAGEIAKGNMDIKLNYERNNFFGAFTWSFDHMRKEIIKARACEKEAIENNKTVIATLSHDIKTPISSMRAYAEGLSEYMDTSPLRRERYLSVIMKKCDEVTKLTNDLFLHSLSDLDKLQIQVEEIEISELILQSVEDMLGDQKDIVIQGSIGQRKIPVDRKRLEQVLENVFNNARKYAKPPITVWTEVSETDYKIHIKDNGKGILPEDIPFVFEKFYRGKNTSGKPGSGLGLYIVKYIMNQMDGEVIIQSGENGLEVILFWNS